jgi:hypothetical protein
VGASPGVHAPHAADDADALRGESRDRMTTMDNRGRSLMVRLDSDAGTAMLCAAGAGACSGDLWYDELPAERATLVTARTEGGVAVLRALLATGRARLVRARAITAPRLDALPVRASRRMRAVARPAPASPPPEHADE